MPEETTERKCKVCGAALPPQNKLYCSVACSAIGRRHRNICKVCGRETKRGVAEYCSAKCRAEASKTYKKCVVCGKEFACSPSDPVVCCGPVCSKIHRQKITGEREGNSEHLKNVREEFSETHTGELHQRAKHYGIVTPSGEIIDVTNLRYWIYNSGLFDNPLTAYREFFRIIRTIDGKEPNPKKQLTHYYGYTVAYHDDGNLLYSKSATKQPRYCKICSSLLPSRKLSYCSEECARKGHSANEIARYHKKTGEKND